MDHPTEYCLLWIQWWPLCMPRSDWASWVQAIGSILAIWGAFRVAGRAIKHNETLLELQRADRIGELFAAPIAVTMAFVEAATACHAAMVEKAAGKVNHPPVPIPDGAAFVPEELVESVGRARVAFDAITPHSLPTAQGVKLMLELRGAMHTVARETESFAFWLRKHWGVTDAGARMADAIPKVESLLVALRAELVRFAQPLK